MKKTFVICFIIFSIFGCYSDEKPQLEIKNTTKTSNDVNKVFGTFTKNSTTMQIKDIYTQWNDEENKLVIYQTPSKITDEEKSKLDNGEMEFFVFSDKNSPDKSKWQWYPFMVTKIQFKSNEIKSDNIQSFYIMVYGIEEKSFTDNINSFPNENEKFEHVSFKNGKLSLKYSGKNSKWSWDIEI